MYQQHLHDHEWCCCGNVTQICNYVASSNVSACLPTLNCALAHYRNCPRYKRDECNMGGERERASKYFLKMFANVANDVHGTIFGACVRTMDAGTASK